MPSFDVDHRVSRPGLLSPIGIHGYTILLIPLMTIGMLASDDCIPTSQISVALETLATQLISRQDNSIPQ
jgi:hypothetical protein